jgi:hypothetical protein
LPQLAAVWLLLFMCQEVHAPSGCLHSCLNVCLQASSDVCMVNVNPVRTDGIDARA